jgi:hypothetical protein
MNYSFFPPFIRLMVFLFLLGTPAIVRAQALPTSGEYIVVSGGPALRQWEDLRAKHLQHDRWWGNFIRPARVRMVEIKQARPSLLVTWLVYRPGYVNRASEDGRPLISFIESVRDTYKVNLVYFSSTNELINYINRGQNRSRNKVVGFEFYGHSNRYAFMFDYSNALMGASKAWLHEKELGRINASAFDRNAFCQSWGCHTGESMSRYWRSATGVPMMGAVGKTDYSNGYRPFLSPGGRWAR